MDTSMTIVVAGQSRVERKPVMTTEEVKEFERRSYEDVCNRGDLAAADQSFGSEFFNYAGPQDWPEGISRTVGQWRQPLSY